MGAQDEPVQTADNSSTTVVGDNKACPGTEYDPAESSEGDKVPNVEESDAGGNADHPT